jgi:histone deacetylase 11
MIPIVYSPGYNVTAFGLERLHPFDGTKYRRIRDSLIRQGLRRAGDFVRPRPMSEGDLLRIHTKEYIRSLRHRQVLARILEVPLVRRLPAWLIHWRVLRPMRCAAGGTVLACRLAIERGLAINLGGGYHHAHRNHGAGFCVYADVPLALNVLHEQARIRSALVVDADVHQGDGIAEIIRPWAWAHVIDFYEDDIFPWPKADEDMPVPLPPGLGGAVYMDLVRERLPRALDRYRPDFVLYNAGSDVLASDTLGHLRLTPEDMAERDLYIVTEVRSRGIPLAMVLSGGYGPLSWEAHARSIEGILARFDKDV